LTACGFTSFSANSVRAAAAGRRNRDHHCRDATNSAGYKSWRILRPSGEALHRRDASPGALCALITLSRWYRSLIASVPNTPCNQLQMYCAPLHKTDATRTQHLLYYLHHSQCHTGRARKIPRIYLSNREVGSHAAATTWWCIMRSIYMIFAALSTPPWNHNEAGQSCVF